MHRIKKNSVCSRGSSIVEFAVVSFVLITVALALFEFCRMGLVYTNLANAARVAVRYAMTHGTDRTAACSSGAGCGSGDTTAATGDICGTSGVLTAFAKGPLDTSRLVCTITGLGGAVGTSVRVKVTYAYDPWFSFLPLRITLASVSQGIITY